MRCLSGSILSLADMPQEFPDQIPFLFHPSFFPHSFLHSFFQTAGISKRKIHNSRLCHPFIILNGTDATLRRKQLQKIRVDEDSIHAQCSASHCEGRLSLPYHQMIPEKKLPCTIGGGIGQATL